MLNSLPYDGCVYAGIVMSDEIAHRSNLCPWNLRGQVGSRVRKPRDSFADVLQCMEDGVESFFVQASGRCCVDGYPAFDTIYEVENIAQQISRTIRPHNVLRAVSGRAFEASTPVAS